MSFQYFQRKNKDDIGIASLTSQLFAIYVFGVDQVEGV